MRTMMGLVLALAMGSAMAGGFQSISFGQRLITTGDGPGKVMEVAGKPDRIVTLQNGRGASVGERWEYYRAGKTIAITISGGVVTDIVETR